MPRTEEFDYGHLVRTEAQPMVMQNQGFTHRYFGRNKHPERYGHHCRIVLRTQFNATVEFEDGGRAVVPQACVRRIR